MAVSQPPLTWESSDASQHPSVSHTLPEEVVTCLQNARFVRLIFAIYAVDRLADILDSYIWQHALPTFRMSL